MEPLRGDRLEDDLTPSGRACCSADEPRLRSIPSDAGSSWARRVSETPAHLVTEARP